MGMKTIKKGKTNLLVHGSTKKKAIIEKVNVKKTPLLKYKRN